MGGTVIAFARLNYAVAYAIWCGTGIVASSVISRLCFGEKFSYKKIAIMTLLLVCIISLKLIDPPPVETGSGGASELAQMEAQEYLGDDTPLLSKQNFRDSL